MRAAIGGGELATNSDAAARQSHEGLHLPVEGRSERLDELACVDIERGEVRLVDLVGSRRRTSPLHVPEVAADVNVVADLGKGLHLCVEFAGVAVGEAGSAHTRGAASEEASGRCSCLGVPASGISAKPMPAMVSLGRSHICVNGRAPPSPVVCDHR